MKAVILAAGRGTRISRQINKIPKSILDIDGHALLWHTVKLLSDNGIDIVVVVGYEHEKIEKALQNFNVTYYYNPFFDVTNSLDSLWFARKELTEDTIIANADVYWTQNILDLLLACNKEVFMLADSSRVVEGDYFFYVENDAISKYGKELKINERNCEYVGVAYFKKTFSPVFTNRLEELVCSQHHQLWWENTLYSFIGEQDISTLDVSGNFWSEVDYIEDYERILKYVNSNNA